MGRLGAAGPSPLAGAGRGPLGHGDPAGHGMLQGAVAAHVGVARGVRCTADQVLVVAGLAQALGLAAQVVLDPGATARVEDPGSPNARAALAAAGVVTRPVPVDAAG